MSSRRPRIKALANLGSKRKAPVAKSESTNLVSQDNKKNSNESIETQSNVLNVTYTKTNIELAVNDKETSTTLNITNETLQNTRSESPSRILSHIEAVPEVNSDTFKCPKSFDFKKTNELDECSKLSSIEDNVIQLDLQKSNQIHSASPSKSRQRIKATPIFGHRRNSLIGSSPNPFLEDEQKRYGDIKSIASPNAYIYGPKWSPAGTGRTRTESGCSTFSDSWSRDLTGKQRKTAYEDHPRLPLSRREFQNKYNGKVPEKSTLKMFDLIYYNPTTNPMETSQKFIPVEELEKEKVPDSLIAPEEANKYEDEEVIPVPQLKLGVNGEVMLDEKSLEIETTANKEARKVLSNTSLMYLDENSGHNGFYKRKKRTKDWSPDETIKFYKCLHTIGTDFSLMLSLFPNRSRRDLKLKFKKEERANLGLVNKALMYPKVFDIGELEKQLEIEEQAYENEQKWKKIKKKADVKHKTKSISGNNFSRSSRSMNDGNLVYLADEFGVTKNKKNPASKTISNRLEDEVSNQDTITENILNQILTDDSYEQETLDILLNIDNFKPNETENICLSTSIRTPPIVIKEQEEPILGNINLPTNIQRLLAALSDGLLAIVSSEDSTGTKTDEIYLIDPDTNQLSDQPMDLPSFIVDIIVNTMAN